MKIEIDIYATDCNTFRFESKEEFERCEHSYASYCERMKSKGYNSFNRFYSEPTKFPCIGLQAGWFPNDNGPDELCMLWLYPGVDCKVVEE